DLSPDGKLVRCHGHFVQQSPAFTPITQPFTICLSHKEGHGPPGARAAAGPVPVPRRGTGWSARGWPSLLAARGGPLSSDPPRVVQCARCTALPWAVLSCLRGGGPP